MPARKNFYLYPLLLLILFAFSACVTSADDREVIYQTAPFTSLNAGDFEGEISYGQLKHRGDFGLGTFNDLDGEMVMLEGKAYKVKVDGMAYPVADSLKTPFAVLTYFDADEEFHIETSSSYAELQQLLDSRLSSVSFFYAVKISGIFPYIKVRSVPAFKKPYPNLTEAVKSQAVFEYADIAGTMVGFRCPDYIGDLNVPGYHLHFISKDKTCGGHLLDCRVNQAVAKLDLTKQFHLSFDDSTLFASPSTTPDMHAAE